MMTGLFIGIIDTIICLGYNIAYRDFSGYTPSALINVSSLIFAVNILLLLTGIVYYLFIKLFGRRDYIFVIVAVLFTIFLLYKTEMGHRFTDDTVNAEFKGLLLGIVLILGISASTLPFFYHSKFFDKYIL
jgi:hypothetical protein